MCGGVGRGKKKRGEVYWGVGRGVVGGFEDVVECGKVC